MRPLASLEDGMAATPQEDDADEETKVPEGVVTGIDDVAEGRTADADALEEFLEL